MVNAMSGWWVFLVVGAVFACAAFLGVQLSAAVCRSVEPFADGPRPGRPPIVALIAGAFFVGSAVAWHGAALPALAIVCVLTVALVACWYSDASCGIVPDYFTLIPLGIVILASLLERNTGPILSACIVLVPFAFAAFVSKGRGMGWGDVKLVALGAAVLGVQSSILAFAGACLAAVVIAAVRRRRNEPIAFAPYLASAIALVLVFPVFPQ
ncbi:MAG: prepilin peptidase [Candidatus Eremiobacteraeota bacterium]|nr:prepilin peptidase [Candidatus Eremiobacteraeota bacterium]